MTTTYRDLGLREAELAIIEHRRAHGWRRVVTAEAQRRAEAVDRYRRNERLALAAQLSALVMVAVLIAAVMR